MTLPLPLLRQLQEATPAEAWAAIAEHAVHVCDTAGQGKPFDAAARLRDEGFGANRRVERAVVRSRTQLGYAEGQALVEAGGHPALGELVPRESLREVGPEGFCFRAAAWQGRPVVLVAGNTDVGVL